jgi:hypothetical protein
MNALYMFLVYPILSASQHILTLPPARNCAGAGLPGPFLGLLYMQHPQSWAAHAHVSMHVVRAELPFS